MPRVIGENHRKKEGEGDRRRKATTSTPQFKGNEADSSRSGCGKLHTICGKAVHYFLRQGAYPSIIFYEELPIKCEHCDTKTTFLRWRVAACMADRERDAGRQVQRPVGGPGIQAARGQADVP